MTACPDLPALTFPDEVVTFLRKEYEKADVILEFGSGGSTFLAAGQPGKTIVSVESDPAWAQRMRDIAAAHPLPSPPRVIHADIGPVLPWAQRPGPAAKLDRFRDYCTMRLGRLDRRPRPSLSWRRKKTPPLLHAKKNRARGPGAVDDYGKPAISRDPERLAATVRWSARMRCSASTSTPPGREGHRRPVCCRPKSGMP